MDKCLMNLKSIYDWAQSYKTCCFGKLRLGCPIWAVLGSSGPCPNYTVKN